MWSLHLWAPNSSCQTSRCPWKTARKSPRHCVGAIRLVDQVKIGSHHRVIVNQTVRVAWPVKVPNLAKSRESTMGLNHRRQKRHLLLNCRLVWQALKSRKFLCCRVKKFQLLQVTKWLWMVESSLDKLIDLILIREVLIKAKMLR